MDHSSGSVSERCVRTSNQEMTTRFQVRQHRRVQRAKRAAESHRTWLFWLFSFQATKPNTNIGLNYQDGLKPALDVPDGVEGEDPSKGPAM